MSRAQAVALAAAAVLAAWLAWVAIGKNGGMAAWSQQPPAPEGRDDPEPSSVCVSAAEYDAGVVFSPHRYPQRCGMQVTSVMHHGFSGIRIPQSPDARWLTSPPSEAAFG